jgi:hypothetical protein
MKLHTSLFNDVISNSGRYDYRIELLNYSEKYIVRNVEGQPVGLI